MNATVTIAAEGLRERKRRQTRERIAEAAMELFLAQGFDATTVDEIAQAAQVSKRSFFDYFPSKEDVVIAWQDPFGVALAAAVAARPADEPLARVVEEALVETIGMTANPRAIARGELIRATPALHARDQLKYARLEATLASALVKRLPQGGDPFSPRLLAMIVVGVMRIAAGNWRKMGRPGTAGDYTRQVFTTVWAQIAEFIAAGRGEAPEPPHAEPRTPRRRRKAAPRT